MPVFPSRGAAGEFRRPRFLTFSLCGKAQPRMDSLRASDARTRGSIRRRVAMADLIYLAIGVLFLVVMGVYAAACDRL